MGTWRGGAGRRHWGNGRRWMGLTDRRAGGVESSLIRVWPARHVVERDADGLCKERSPRGTGAVPCQGRFRLAAVRSACVSIGLGAPKRREKAGKEGRADWSGGFGEVRNHKFGRSAQTEPILEIIHNLIYFYGTRRVRHGSRPYICFVIYYQIVRFIDHG